MNLYDCITKNDVVGARTLLQQGHDPNKLDEYGQTPLFIIVYNKTPRQKEFLRLFIEFGANVNFQKANDEATVLHNARGDIAGILIENGADITIKTKSGLSPLHNAIDVPSAETFIKYGLSINVRDNYSSTPLHHFVYSNLELVRFAIQQGADVSATDVNGYTPLICLAQTEYVTHFEGLFDTMILKAELLLNAGADINAIDLTNMSAYDHALKVDNIMFADWLRVKQKTKNGI